MRAVVELETALRQPGGGLLAGKERAFDIDGENAVVFRLGHLADGLDKHNAGVVDQNIELPKMGDSLIEEPDDIGHAPHIGLNRQRLAASGGDFGDQLLGHGGLVGIIDHHRGTLPAKAFGNGPADATRGAGDQGDLAF